MPFATVAENLNARTAQFRAESRPRPTERSTMR